MANLVPGAYPKPNPLNVSAGKAIRSASALDPGANGFGVDPLFQSANWLLANFGHRDVVTACWPRIDGVWQATETALAFGAPNAVYRIPKVPGLTSITVTFVVPVVGGFIVPEGEIEFHGGGAVANFVVVAPGIYTGSVALDFGVLDYATVFIYAKTNAGKTFYLESLDLSYAPASSPMPSGVRAEDGAIAFDEGQFDPDQPLTAEAMHALFDDIDAIESVKQTYAQWSVWRINGDAPAAADVRLHSIPNTWVVPVWRKPDNPAIAEETLKAWVRLEGLGTAATQVVICVGAGYNPNLQTRVVIPVNAGAAENWYEVDVPVKHDLRVATGMPPGYDTMVISIWPNSSTSDGSNLEQTIPTNADKLSTALIRSVCIWGV